MKISCDVVRDLLPLYIDGVLCYELSDGRRCCFQYMPPHFSVPICQGLLEWCEVINDRKED